MEYDHTNENLIKLAKLNIAAFDRESELAEYIAFLFSELAELDSDWEKTIQADLQEMESF